MRLENIDVFLEDFSVDVISGENTFKAIFDLPDNLIGSGMVISTEYTLIVKTSDVETNSDGDPLTVDGGSYEIRKIEKIDDGKFSKVTLSKI